MMDWLTFEQRRALALEIMGKTEKGTRKAGSFLGGLVFDHTPLTDKQADWLEILAARAGVEIPHAN
jgi:hypothetical protein